MMQNWVVELTSAKHSDIINSHQSKIKKKFCQCQTKKGTI